MKCRSQEDYLNKVNSIVDFNLTPDIDDGKVKCCMDVVELFI